MLNINKIFLNVNRSSQKKALYLDSYCTFNPFQTNEISHNATYDEQGQDGPLYIISGYRLYFPKNIVFLSLIYYFFSAERSGLVG